MKHETHAAYMQGSNGKCQIWNHGIVDGGEAQFVISSHISLSRAISQVQ